MAMVRGGLIGIIYSKATELKSANINESAAMTLMGTDVERIAENWYLMFTEIWANVIQMGIAMFLLERQLGAVCIAPIIIALSTLFLFQRFTIRELFANTFEVSTVCQSRLSQYVTGRQKIWLEAIQKRVNFTSEVLGSMKNIKMLGLTEKMGSILQEMRVRELNLSKKYRHLQTVLVCFGE